MSKVTLAAIAALILSILSFIAEGTFYGGIDENGVLQESAFLPLAVFSALAAIALFFVAALRAVLRRRSVG